MFGKSTAIALLVLACTLASAGEAMAQRAFLFVPGIPGDSTVEGYVDWINILAIRQTATSTSRRSIACDISIVKNIDVAGPALWATAATGVTVSEMLISVLKNGVAEGEAAKLYDIRLTDVRIVAVQASAGTVDASETITLLPREVKLTYYTQTAAGLPGTPATETFSCQ